MAGVKKYNIIDDLFEKAFNKYSGRGHDINWNSVLEYMQATNKSNYNITMDDLKAAARRTRRRDPHYSRKVLLTDKNTRPKSIEDLGTLPKQGQSYKLFDMDGHDKAKNLSGNIFFDNASLDEFNQVIFNFIDESGVPFQIMGDSINNIDLYANKKHEVRDLNEIKKYQQNLFDIEDHLEYMAKELGTDQQSAYFDYNVKPLYEEVQQYETKYHVGSNKYTKEIHNKYERQVKKNKLYDKENRTSSNTIDSRRSPESNPQPEVLNNTNDIDLDELNKQWYENKQKEFAERELEIKKEFSDVNTLKPEDVIGDTVEETIENTKETIVKSAAGEVIEEAGEKIVKEVTGINVELDGLNKKKTPKKLKKGTGKYKAKNSTINNEIYDRLDNSRYWAVDFPGSNGDFAVLGPIGTKRLKKEKIDQQRRKRKYEQTRQKYEKKQQQRQQQKQKDFVDNTIHINDKINLDEINKQWYESKQKEFEQRQKEIDDYFENNADIDPEDVLKDDYEPDVNKYTDDIDTLEKNFEQSKDFDINKGIDDALDAVNKTVETTREGGSISKYLKEFSNMGFFDKVQTLGAAAGAVSEYKNARRQGHGVVSSVARAGVDFALGEAMGLYYPLFLLAKEAPGMIVKGSEMLYKENRKMNSMANQQIFGDAQFQDTQQLATMRQSGMEMAKMAQYNLQQTLMGNEATYFHR